MNRFSIRDIENLTGIKAHTLRIWEQRYGIIQPKRTDTNIRYYDAEDLRHVLSVALLNKYGYKISKIHNMSEDDMKAAIEESTNQELQLEALINEFLEATIDMDIVRFNELLTNYTEANNLEKTVEVLLFGYLEKIGIMWMTNKIFPAQEHLVSNIISRKIQIAIENLENSTSFSPKVLLYLPEGELHEIGLLYANYILLKNKKHVIYLGPNSPIDQVELVCEQLKPDYLYTHITSVSNDFDGNSYFKKLSHIHPGDKIIVSGTMLQKTNIDIHKFDIHFIDNLEETKSKLANLQ